MIKKWNAILFVVPFWAMLVFSANGGWGRNADTERKVVILFTHDAHSYFLPHRVGTAGGKAVMTGGYAKIATLIQQERALYGTDKTLLVDAGDFAMGTLFHTSFATEGSELRLMGDMGYDVITFGNHDFDFHPDGLAKTMLIAKEKGRRMPAVVASNVVFSPDGKGDKRLMDAFSALAVKERTVIERNGIRIGLFGIMGKDAAEDTPFAKPVTFDDPIQSSKRMVEQLRNEEKVDVVICLSHSGTWVNKSRSEDEILARKVGGIDVIISGHTHTVLPKPIVSGKTIIVSSGSYGEYLGKLELGYTRENGTRLAAYEIKPVAGSISDDKMVASEVEKYDKILNRNYLSQFGYASNEVLGESSLDMESLAVAYANPGEMGLGNLITDAYRYAVEKAEGTHYEFVDVAIQPLGHIRASLYRGDITTADVFRVLSLGLGPDGIPGYPLVSFYLTGKELKDLLEVETSIAPMKEDAHVQFSGVKFTYNPHRIIFDRVTTVSVLEKDGRYKPLEPNRLYRIVMNLYTVQMVNFVGKSSYGLLSMKPKDKKGQIIGDLMKMLVDSDLSISGIQELKEWTALASFIKTFQDTDGNRIPNIPERYRKPEGRFSSLPSWNPIGLVRGGNAITYGILGAAILILVIMGLSIRFVALKIRSPKAGV